VRLSLFTEPFRNVFFSGWSKGATPTNSVLCAGMCRLRLERDLTYCAFRAPIEKNAIQPIRYGTDLPPPQMRQEDLLVKRRKDLSKYNVMPEETRLVRNLIAIETVSDALPENFRHRCHF
jgi:hypothetical protein